jgi:hypothetical protein
VRHHTFKHVFGLGEAVLVGVHCVARVQVAIDCEWREPLEGQLGEVDAPACTGRKKDVRTRTGELGQRGGEQGGRGEPWGAAGK